MAFLPHRPSRTLVLGGVAMIAIATLTFFGGRKFTGTTQSRPPAAESESRASGKNLSSPNVSKGDSAASVSTSVVIPSAAEARPKPVLPAAVAQLLPSVQAPVTNWKEFKPE